MKDLNLVYQKKIKQFWRYELSISCTSVLWTSLLLVYLQHH